MGQKITEYPQVDQWVKLMREADKAGADTHRWRRPATDDREWDRYQQMETARQRVIAGWQHAKDPRVLAEDLTHCQRCGILIDDITCAFLKRSIFWQDGSRTDLYLCGECAGR